MMYDLGVPAGVTTHPQLGSEFGSPNVTQTSVLSGSGVSECAQCLRSKSRFYFVLKALLFLWKSSRVQVPGFHSLTSFQSSTAPRPKDDAFADTFMSAARLYRVL